MMRTIARVSACGMLAAAVCGPVHVAGQPLPTDDLLARIDEATRAHLARNNIPGAVVAVGSRGRVLHQATYGLADVELGVPVSDSSVFEIGSLSKQFVAVAALQLVEERRLDLDAAIHDFLPWLPGEWRGVSVRQLLNHTSGIPDYEAIQGYEAYRDRFLETEIVRIAQSHPPDFPPGEGYHYTNTGYYIASLILESVDSMPLARILERRIFDPVGMARTRFADPADIIPNRVSGYYQDRNGNLVNRDPTQTSATLGAGGLVSTVGDLLLWDAALYGTELLSEASKEALWSPTTLPDGRVVPYGFGWEVEPFDGRRQQYHYGMTAGFIANITRLPDDDLTVVVLANRYREDLGRIVVPTLRAFLGGE